MASPFWFQLIKKWREKGMGHYGVSFPFLVGAITNKYGGDINEEYVRGTFAKIIEHPAADYYCEVRWCPNIDEPVVSVEPSNTINNKSIKAQYTNNDGEVSLAFTNDLMSMFTLNCETKEECLTKLIARTLENAEQGLFSKNKGVFGGFTVKEMEFIEDVYSTSNNA
ncbi:MAG: hypothetical protein AB2708_20465 [Candidatus Thiodiazotropha taylori]